MTSAILFLSLAAIAFVCWLALGSRWLIWVFVLVTLALTIDATHPGVANRPILPTALNDGG